MKTVILDNRFKFITLPQPQATLLVTGDDHVLIDTTHRISHQYQKYITWIGIHAADGYGPYQVKDLKSLLLRQVLRNRDIPLDYVFPNGAVVGAVQVGSIDTQTGLAYTCRWNIVEQTIFSYAYPLPSKRKQVWTIGEFSFDKTYSDGNHKHSLVDFLSEEFTMIGYDTRETYGEYAEIKPKRRGY